MKKFGQRGVAAITVVVVVAISAGAGAGAPVAVDVADVDPDHPLYGLERIGERIRMVGDEDQMHERCHESYLMYGEYGKEALRYDVFKEFVGKAEKLLADPATEEKVKAWLESEMDRVGIVTDVFDVDPDHPLYGYENIGELLRDIKPEELMKERLGEFMAMCKKGHGKDYAAVMEAFREKFEALIVEKPVDNAEREKLLEWMEDQKENLTDAQIELTEELLEEFPKEKIPPEIAELIEEKKERFEALAEQIKAAATDEEREAALRGLKKAIVEQIERFKEDAPRVLAEVEKCINAYKVSYAVNVEVKIELEIGVNINVEKKFDNDLASLETKYEQYKAEMPEKIRKLIENLKAEAVTAGKTKAGLICLEELEDELEMWKKKGKAAWEKYSEKYAPCEEKIEDYLAIPECPEAIKKKADMLRKAVEEGDYEEAEAVLEDLTAKMIKWTPPVGWTPPAQFLPDLVPPTISRLKITEDITEAVVSGKVTDDVSTYVDITVVITYDGKTKEVSLEADGSFSVKVPLPIYTIDVVARDLAGNESSRRIYG